MSELMKAVNSKNTEKIMELLSKKGVKLDEADAHGNTPLNYACAMGISEEVILKMISMGASCTIPNNNGTTPLNHAVYSRRTFLFILSLSLSLSVSECDCLTTRGV